MYRSNSSSSVEQLLASEIGSSVHRVPSACTSGQARSSEEQLPASSSRLLEEQLLASSSWLLAKAGSTPFVLSGRLVFTGICVGNSPAGVTPLQAASLLTISSLDEELPASIRWLLEERLLASEIGSSVHRVTGSSEEQLPASSS